MNIIGKTRVQWKGRKKEEVSILNLFRIKQILNHDFMIVKLFFTDNQNKKKLATFCRKKNGCCMEKNGFVTATKLGTTNKIFVAATRNFAAATKRFVHRTKHFVVVTKYFCYPYFNK